MFLDDEGALVGNHVGEKLLVPTVPTQKCAMVLTSTVFSISESGASMNFFPVTIPALFTRMPTSPASRFTCRGEGMNGSEEAEIPTKGGGVWRLVCAVQLP